MAALDPETELAYFGRGLTRAELERINDRLPDTRAFRHSVLDYHPDVLAMCCPPGSGREDLPQAGVCLQDTSIALGEARYALAQAAVGLAVWRRDARNEKTAVVQAQFYVANAAHRLYSAGEHIAAAILYLLGLTEANLRAAASRGHRISRQARLARYLKKERPGHPITTAVLDLSDCPEWFAALEYRSDSVHNQPPRVEGVGSFNRDGPRWKETRSSDGTVTGHQVSLGGNDPADTTVDAILANGVIAATAFLRFADSIVSCFDRELSMLGVNVSHDKGRVTVNLPSEQNEDSSDHDDV